MTVELLLVAGVILVCLLASKFSAKLGVPTLLVFIFLGMVFGSDGVFKIQFDNYSIAEQICSIALIFIMFYGGFGTNWQKAKTVAVKAVMLSTVGVLLTAAITGIFCHFVLGFGLLESFLIGAVISSTDAASVFSILRSKRLNLKYNTASLLEVESGSNDPCSYMLTVIVLSLMNGEASGAHIIYMIFAQIVYGAVIGVVMALICHFILTKVKFSNDGFESILVFSMALVSYALSSVIGGNGYLSTYITGLILGNKSFKSKKKLVNFFDGITGLMQILIFFLLGLLAFPSQLPQIVLPALAIALFLTFIARPISVFAILTPFKCPLKQQLLVSWSGLRGAASIVFAIMAMVSPAYIKNDVFHVVFFIVLFSISLQGTLIPFISNKLNMIDNNSDVMKTFNDYADEVPVQFLKLKIGNSHPWCDKALKDIDLLPNVLVALIIRNGAQIVPKGDTVIMKNDNVIVSGPSLDKEFEGCLTEIRIDADNKWLGKSLSDIKFGPDKLVILIKRNEKVVIPTGSTVVMEDDVLIMNQA